MPAENVTPEPLTMAQEHEDRLRTYAEIGMAFRYDEVRAILAELDATRAAHADMVRRFDNLLAEARSEDAKLSATIVDLEAKLAEAQAERDAYKAANAETYREILRALTTAGVPREALESRKLHDAVSVGIVHMQAAAQATIKALCHAGDAVAEDYASLLMSDYSTTSHPDPAADSDELTAWDAARCAALASRPSDAPTTESGK